MITKTLYYNNDIQSFVSSEEYYSHRYDFFQKDSDIAMTMYFMEGNNNFIDIESFHTNVYEIEKIMKSNTDIFHNLRISKLIKIMSDDFIISIPRILNIKQKETEYIEF